MWFAVANSRCRRAGFDGAGPVKWMTTPHPGRSGSQPGRPGPSPFITPDGPGGYAGSLFVLGVAAFLALPFIPDYFDTTSLGTLGQQRVYLWAVSGLLLTATIFLLGMRARGVWFGALLNRQNRLDLARLQLAVWTIILLPAIHITLFGNLLTTGGMTLIISTEVWLLLGIDIVTLTSTSIVLGAKRDSPPPTQREAARHGVLVINDGYGNQKHLMGDGTTEVIGVLVANTEPGDWSWSNLFLGSELGNQRSVDIGKVQMFFFSAILFTAYSTLLVQTFRDTAGPLESLPGFPGSLLTLIAISHAGYLTNLAVRHTDTD